MRWMSASDTFSVQGSGRLENLGFWEDNSRNYSFPAPIIQFLRIKQQAKQSAAVFHRGKVERPLFSIGL